MKQDFLKKAGVKTEKEFYSKYPNEQSFFKAHPDMKKMAFGGTLSNALMNTEPYSMKKGNVKKAPNGIIEPIIRGKQKNFFEQSNADDPQIQQTDNQGYDMGTQLRKGLPSWMNQDNDELLPLQDFSLPKQPNSILNDSTSGLGQLKPSGKNIGNASDYFDNQYATNPNYKQSADNSIAGLNKPKKPINLSGDIATGLGIAAAIIPDQHRDVSMYPHPQDQNVYNPHPYGVTNSQGYGSQALSAEFGANINSVHSNNKHQYPLIMEDGGIMYDYKNGGVETLPVQTLWGGNIEHMANNPYSQSPSSLVKGASHNDGGVGLQVNGGTKIEAEGGEPIVSTNGLQSSGNQSSDAVTIVGAVPIIHPETGNRVMAKSAFKDIINNEVKATRIQTKANDLLEKTDPRDKFGDMTANTAKLMQMKSDNIFKKSAVAKDDIIKQQTFINNLSEHLGIEPKKVAKQFAKYGKTIPRADDGLNTDNNGMIQRNNLKNVNTVSYNDAYGNRDLEMDPRIKSLYDNYQKEVKAGKKKGPAIGAFQKKIEELYPEQVLKSLNEHGNTNYGKNHGIAITNPKAGIDYTEGPRTEEWAAYTQKPVGLQLPNLGPINLNPKIQKLPIQTSEVEKPNEGFGTPDTHFTNPGKITPYQSYIPEKLHFSQYAPNITGALLDRERPVNYSNPEAYLEQPYQVSFQDMRNENYAALNKSQRMNNYDPSIGSSIQGQYLDHSDKVNAEEFRTNQKLYADPINENRQILTRLSEEKAKNANENQINRLNENHRFVGDLQKNISNFADKESQLQRENMRVAMYKDYTKFGVDDKGMITYDGTPWQTAVQNNPDLMKAFGPTVAGMQKGVDKNKGYSQRTTEKDVVNGKVKVKNKEITKGDKVPTGKNGGIVKMYNEYK